MSKNVSAKQGLDSSRRQSGNCYLDKRAAARFMNARHRYTSCVADIDAMFAADPQITILFEEADRLADLDAKQRRGVSAASKDKASAINVRFQQIVRECCRINGLSRISYNRFELGGSFSAATPLPLPKPMNKKRVFGGKPQKRAA